MSFSDLALARRLERAEGGANADFVDARALMFPDRGAAWLQFGGALAMFDGVDSPLTQTFGLGLDGPVVEEDLARIERFYDDRHAHTFHEISPLADASLLPLLHRRGYEMIELTSVLWRPIDGDERGGALVGRRPLARPIESFEHDVWADTAANGWSHLPELTPFLRELAVVNAHRRNHVAFLVEIDGEPIAAGGLAIVGGVALLAGASTIPSARKQGAQAALLDARLRYGSAHGCDIAMMGALPGSDSQRNAERQGFRIAYTRMKWRRMHVS